MITMIGRTPVVIPQGGIASTSHTPSPMWLSVTTGILMIGMVGYIVWCVYQLIKEQYK